MELNDLAIVLTKKIEWKLYQVFGDKGKIPPSFYNVRETILEVLKENMEVLAIEETESPRFARELKPELLERIVNDQLRSNACRVVEMIFKSKDHFDKFVFEDEYSYYKTTRRTIAVIKSAKIAREANESARQW